MAQVVDAKPVNHNTYIIYYLNTCGLLLLPGAYIA